MTNKKLGNDFEQELCRRLANEGFWVHNFANRKNGQPADIIAVRNRLAFLVDAKVCTNDVFPFKRIESNQMCAMFRWQQCGNSNAYFALKASREIYMINYKIICDLMRDGVNQLNLADMAKHGLTLKMWLTMVKCSM